MTNPEALALPENKEYTDWISQSKLAEIAGEDLSRRIISEIVESWDESQTHISQNGLGELYSPLFTRVFTRSLELLETPEAIATNQSAVASEREIVKKDKTRNKKQGGWNVRIIETLEELPREQWPKRMMDKRRSSP